MIATPRRLTRYLAPIALLAAAACGGDSGTNVTPTDTITPAERQALINLSNNAAFQNALMGGSAGVGIPGGAEFVGLIAQHLQSLGTMTVGSTGASATLIAPSGGAVTTPVRALQGTPGGSYKAFGGEFLITVTSSTGTIHLIWAGVIGVNDIDTPTDVIVAGAIKLADNVSSGIIGNTEIFTDLSSVDDTTTTLAFASYAHLTSSSTGTVYSANLPGGSGSVAITSASFSGNQGCGLPADPTITACGISTGTLGASFHFTAKEVDGDATVTIPSVTVSVPAMRVTMTLDDDALGSM